RGAGPNRARRRARSASADARRRRRQHRGAARQQADAAAGRRSNLPRDQRRHQSARAAGERFREARPRRPRLPAHPILPRSHTPALLNRPPLRAHTRRYLPLAHYISGTRRSRSTGAFAHRGEELLPDEQEENLVRRLRRWAPYVGRFGLIALELHTLPPDVAAANLDKTPAVAYDGTHGFSDQYLVELPNFLECAREAELHADRRFHGAVPRSQLAPVRHSF